MARTLQQAVVNVRELLGGPLPQAPSYDRIISELEAEMQYMTNRTNNKGNAWQTSSFNFTTTAGTRKYQITSGLATDFYKALSVKTVPSNTQIDPEYELEFVEQEHLSSEWAWLAQNQGNLWYSSHDSQIIAFYRTISNGSIQYWVELRPTPAAAETYQILYMQTDWFTPSGPTAINLPHSSQSRFFESQVALNLLVDSKWCFNDQVNMEMVAKLTPKLAANVERYGKVFEEHISSLESEDVIHIRSWVDDIGMT